MSVEQAMLDPPQRTPSTSSTAEARPALPPMVAALLHPEAYRHPADRLTLHESHASWVILAGPYAYKIKKPVDLGFLDFTTPERRAANCADEVRLNRRLCPDLYLGVVEIVERDGAYGVGGPGRPVEPAVWMRRLPETGMLATLLARGCVSRGLVRRIARQLVEFHATATTGPGVDEYGSLATIRANWDENFAQTIGFVGRTLTRDTYRKIVAYVDDFVREHADLLERRAREGYIRDGHGDLHAGSICVERGRVHLFDCLEFAPRFRCADVAAEVAFLAMDLDHHGRADLGAAFVDAYIQRSGDRDLRLLLDFYRCYRAYVRGKVLGLRLNQPDLSAEIAAEIEAEARAYFDLAWAYAGGLGGPTIVVTMGLPASGKTTLARGLARHLGLVHLSSDVMRQQLAGVKPTDRRIEAFGQGIYGGSLTRRTYAALRHRAAQWLRRGYSVVVDATFGQPAERAAIQAVAARTGAHLRVLVCRTDEATICQRLVARAGAADAVSDAHVDIWPALRAAYRQPVELTGAVTLDSTLSPTRVLEQAIAALSRCPDPPCPLRPGE